MGGCFAIRTRLSRSSPSLLSPSGHVSIRLHIFSVFPATRSNGTFTHSCVVQMRNTCVSGEVLLGHTRPALHALRNLCTFQPVCAHTPPPTDPIILLPPIISHSVYMHPLRSIAFLVRVLVYA